MKKKDFRFLISLLLFCTPAILSAQRIKGSDTVLPLTQELAEMYMKLNPQATITVTNHRSGHGFTTHQVQ